MWHVIIITGIMAIVVIILFFCGDPWQKKSVLINEYDEKRADVTGVNLEWYVKEKYGKRKN